MTSINVTIIKRREITETPRSDQCKWSYIHRFVLEDDGNKSFSLTLKGFMDVKGFFFSWVDYMSSPLLFIMCL